mgnify:CR=1 FL=1
MSWENIIKYRSDTPPGGFFESESPDERSVRLGFENAMKKIIDHIESYKEGDDYKIHMKKAVDMLYSNIYEGQKIGPRKLEDQEDYLYEDD